MNPMKNEAITDLMAFLKNGTSPYHVVEYGSRELEQAGFLELELKDAWQLHQAGPISSRSMVLP